MGGFWSSLWPNLVATFLGVVLGLPAGLYLSTLQTRRQGAREIAARAQTLRLVASALVESVRHNGERSAVLAYLIGKGVAPWDTPLETARWEAIRDPFVQATNDATLIDEIALFFSDVKLNADRVDRLFAFAYGQWSEHPHATEIAERVGAHLSDSLPELEQAAAALCERLLPLTQ